MAEACNTGLELLIRNDVPALQGDRLSWVDQNYIRDETLTVANAALVAAQSHLTLANLWAVKSPRPMVCDLWFRCERYMPVQIRNTSASAVALPGTT